MGVRGLKKGWGIGVEGVGQGVEGVLHVGLSPFLLPHCIQVEFMKSPTSSFRHAIITKDIACHAKKGQLACYT